MSSPSNSEDVRDREAEAQGKGDVRVGKRPASQILDATAGPSTNSVSNSADLQDDPTTEAPVEEIGSLPSAARTYRAMPTLIPARRATNEVFEVPETTHDLGNPMMDAQDDSSISNSKDENHSGAKFVLNRGKQKQNVFNFGPSNKSGAANMMFSDVNNNVQTGSQDAIHTGVSTQNFDKLYFRENSTVYFGPSYNYYTPTLFGGLQALTTDTTDDTAIKFRQSRMSSQSVSTLPTTPVTYLPHASVTKPELKTALIKIAVACQFLDAGFAEYFRTAIGHLQGTAMKLRRIREQICSRQSKSAQYIGLFGEYCERLSVLPEADTQIRMEKYQACATGDEILPYLQDALEVPYWNMMTDQFIKSNHINNQFTYDAVLSVINDKRRELKLRLRQMKQKWHDDLPQAIEDGIARRITILDALLAQTSDKYDSLEEQQVQALQRSPTSELDAAANSTMPKPAPLNAKVSSVGNITDLEKVSLLSLFFFFTALIMVPFGMGFAGNWDTDLPEAIGSTSDPDFKWLIATTMLAIFGNIYAVVPLRKLTRGSGANTITQFFLWFSIALGIISVSVYPFWNKAWSSSLSFFCSFFAIGSVFVSAQHTSDTASSNLTNASKAKKA